MEKLHVIDNIIKYRTKHTSKKTSIIKNYENIRIEEWSVIDFIKIQDCPVQRDIEIRVKKARKNHLNKHSITHGQVSIAELPNGAIYKIDGHTRSYLWNENKLERPNFLIVMVYKVKNESELRNLYYQFDSSSAVESNTDKLTGAFKYLGFSPKSRLLNRSLTSVISSFFKNENKQHNSYMVNAAYTLLPYIKIADAQNFKCSKNTSAAPFITSLLNIIITDKNVNYDFWKLLFADGGIKIGNRRNFVELAITHTKNLESKSAGSVFPQIVNIITDCYYRYKKDPSKMLKSYTIPKGNKRSHKYIIEQLNMNNVGV